MVVLAAACGSPSADDGGSSATGGGEDDVADDRGGADETATSGSEDEPTADDPRFAELVALQCAGIDDCLCVGAPALDDCPEDLAGRWEDRLAAGLDRGLTFDSACLDSMVEEVGAAGCQRPYREHDPICGRFCALFHGAGELGSACTAEDALVSDCAQGLVCDAGVCKEPCEGLVGRIEGQQCWAIQGPQFDDCRPSSFCSFDTKDCEPKAPVGESCAGGVPCVDEGRCIAQECVPISVEGEECIIDMNCAPGLDCFDSICTAEGDVGDSCNPVGCLPGLHCNQSGECAPPASAGEDCQGAGSCETGHVCVESTCVAVPQEAGEPCAGDRCGPGLRCNVTTGESLCEPLLEDGEPCDDVDLCLSGSCPAGSCAPAPGLGEDCSGLDLCARGLVCNGETCQVTTARAPAVCTYRGW